MHGSAMMCTQAYVVLVTEMVLWLAELAFGYTMGVCVVAPWH